jgi:hypothetical protein
MSAHDRRYDLHFRIWAYLLGTPCNRYPRLKGIPFRVPDHEYLDLYKQSVNELTPFSVPVDYMYRRMLVSSRNGRTSLQNAENLHNPLKASP